MASPNLKLELASIKEHIGGDTPVVLQENNDGSVDLCFEMEVALPREKEGLLIHEKEPVKLRFPSTYPLHPPRPLLRKDFPRAVAHVQPSIELDPTEIEPCVVDEKLETYFPVHGLSGLLTQLQFWLDNAAFDLLRSRDDRWEPARRNGLPFQIVLDHRVLAEKIGRRLGQIALGLDLVGEDILSAFGYTHDHQTLSIPQLADAIKDKRCGAGVIVAWPSDDHRNISTDTLFDQQMSVEQVLALAGHVGIHHLRSLLENLARHIGEADEKFLLFVILVVRRPKPVHQIENASLRYEFFPICCFFRTTHNAVTMRPTFTFDRQQPCYPAQIVDVFYPSRQQVLSGKSFSKNQHLFLVGCGSLGSKIAIQLGKSGFGEMTLCDYARLRPHNAGRMGIGITDNRVLEPKVDLVARELEGLEHSVGVEKRSLAALVKGGQIVLPDQTTLLLDTTASPVVHNALIMNTVAPKECKLALASFYAGGRVAIFAIESVARKTDLHDIIALFWAHWARSSDEAVEAVWGDASSLERFATGLGCDSWTMIMSDANASLLAAGITEKLTKVLEKDTAEELPQISFATSDKMSVHWCDLDADYCIDVTCKADWKIKISTALANKIEQQARAQSPSETGGYILGFINKLAKRITITNFLAAPPDSHASPSEFTLGVEGATDALLRVNKRTFGNIRTLGTWHSHPKGGGASKTDTQTLHSLAREMGGEPAMLLIWRPEGLLAVMEDD